MMTRCYLVLIALSFCAGLQFVRADNPGKAVGDFTLPDTQGQKVSLGQFKDKKAVVLVFLGTECPVNNLYLSRLNELHREFAPKGVQFLALNANRQDTPQRVADHAKKHEIAFPVLRDHANQIADRLGAQRTPEAFVLDGDRTLRYQGRIDDQYGIGVQRAQPTRRDLAEAVKEVLAGKPVSVAATTVSGCKIGRVTPAKDDGVVTYARHVSRILQKHCQECHRPGQIGPMPLLTYEDASAWAETIKEVVQDRRMPPWHADPKHGKFANDRSLSKEDRTTLLAWVAGGTPRGNDKDLPPPRQFASTWRIGKPDVVIDMPVEYQVPAVAPKKGIEYQHFSVKTDFPEDRWVERAEARAGAPEVVHHIILFVIPPGKKFSPENAATATLAGTAPGDMPMMLPPGMAKRLPKGSTLIFQMHYTPNGKAQKDRSSVGLIFAKEPPKQEVVTLPVYQLFFRIPAGAANHQVNATYTCQRDGHIIGFMPHMHLRGKDFVYHAEYPDGKKQTLLSVPHFDFNWQSIYRPLEPVPAPKGTKIHCVAHFDNSAKNPNNPDATREVYWGDQTWEEMMIGWIDVAYDMAKK